MKELKPLEMVRIAVTPYCDLRCKHCYAANVSLNQMIGFEKDQMSIETIENFIDHLMKNQKLKRISLTGGEILTARVWERTKILLKFALERGLVVQMNTSGSDTVTIDDIYAVAGDNFKNIVFHVSLDGTSKETVDEFRGKVGAFDRSVRFIKAASERGGYVEVRFTITSENYDITTECYKMVSGFGATCFVAKVVFPTGSVYNHDEIRVNEELVGKVQSDLLALSVGNKTSVMLPSPLFFDRNNVPEGANCIITECSCGDTSLYLSFDGDLLPCPYLQGSEYYKDLKIGNINDPDFDFDKLWVAPTTFKAHRSVGSYECATYKIMAQEIKAE